MRREAMNVAFKDPQINRSLDALAEALLLPSGIDGVYARTAAFEDVVTRLATFISRHREPGTEVLRFPPVMSRRQLERSGSEAEVRGTGRAFRIGQGMDRCARGRRPCPDAGRLLSGLSDRGEPR
jgi:hypothetical protein